MWHLRDSDLDDPACPRLGSVQPRIVTTPLRELTPATSLGFDLAEFAEHVLRCPLLPWQKELGVRLLELVDERDTFGRVIGQRLRYRTAVIEVARQNGKSLFMIVLALYFMLVYQPGELVLSTAQDLDTSERTWEQGVDLVKSVATLAKMIPARKGEILTNGKKALNLTNGSEWKVATASRKGGRGKSARLVLMDELREHLNWQAWAAVTNTTLAQSDGLVLGLSNAGDTRSIVLRDMRAKAIAKRDDPKTTLFVAEWSAPGPDDPAGDRELDPDDVEAVLLANPACGWPGTGMSLETLRAARDSSTDADWRTENLCQWVVAMDSGPWDEGTWEALTDARSRIADDSPVVLAADTALDRSMSYVAIAGWSAADPHRVHVEVIAAGPGNAWAAPWIDDRFEAIGAAGVAVQGPKGSPAADIGEALERLGIPVLWAQGPAVTGSATGFYDAVRDGHVVHRGQPVLDMAALTAAVRLAGDGVFMWDRRKSPVDVAPLVAVSMAWRFLTERPDERRSAYEADDGGLVVV